MNEYMAKSFLRLHKVLKQQMTSTFLLIEFFAPNIKKLLTCVIKTMFSFRVACIEKRSFSIHDHSGREYNLPLAN